MNKKEVDNIKKLRSMYNEITNLKEYYEKNKIDKFSPIIDKKIKEIIKRVKPNSYIKYIIKDFSDGIYDENILKMFILNHQIYRKLEKKVKTEEEKYMLYLKEKEIQEYNDSMKILTFALVVVTSFLSAEAIIGNKKPIIIFILGCGLFGFSVSLISMNLINKEFLSKRKSYALFFISFIIIICIILFYSFK